MSEDKTPPTVAEIGDLRHQLTGDPDWRRQKEKDKRWFEMYHGEHDVESIERTEDMLVDPTAFVTRLNTARDFTDHIIGVENAYPTHEVDAPGEGPRRQEQAQKVKRWLDAAPPQLERQQGDETHFRGNAETNVFGYCGQEVYASLAPWQAAGYPEREKGQREKAYTKAADEWRQLPSTPLPLCDRIIGAMCWYPILDGSKVSVSLEVVQTKAQILLSRYGYDIKEQGLKPMDDVEVTRYIDDTWVIVAWGKGVGGKQSSILVPAGAHVQSASGYACDPYEHRMPVQPGRAPVVLRQGMRTHDDRPGYRFTSLIESIYDACKTEDFIATRRKVKVAFEYLATVYATVRKLTQLDATGKTNDVQQWIWGGYNELPEGKEINIVTPTPEGEAAQQLWEQVRQKIDSRWAPVLRGEFDGQTSGYLFNLAKRLALGPHDLVMDRQATSDSEAAALRLMSLGALEELVPAGKGREVYVGERDDDGWRPVGLAWPDVEGIAETQIRCSREQNTQEDILANFQAADVAVAGGWLSQETAAKEIAHVRNWPDERKKWKMERFLAGQYMTERTNQEIALKTRTIVDAKEGLPPEQAGGMNLPPGLRTGGGLAGAQQPQAGMPGGPQGADAAPVPPQGNPAPDRLRGRAPGQRRQPGGRVDMPGRGAY